MAALLQAATSFTRWLSWLKHKPEGRRFDPDGEIELSY
jgi:hypothetical protein